MLSDIDPFNILMGRPTQEKEEPSRIRLARRKKLLVGLLICRYEATCSVGLGRMRLEKTFLRHS